MAKLRPNPASASTAMDMTMRNYRFPGIKLLSACAPSRAGRIRMKKRAPTCDVSQTIAAAVQARSPQAVSSDS